MFESKEALKEHCQRVPRFSLMYGTSTTDLKTVLEEERIPIPTGEHRLILTTHRIVASYHAWLSAENNRLKCRDDESQPTILHLDGKKLIESGYNIHPLGKFNLMPVYRNKAGEYWEHTFFGGQAIQSLKDVLNHISYVPDDALLSLDDGDQRYLDEATNTVGASLEIASVILRRLDAGDVTCQWEEEMLSGLRKLDFAPDF
jgi:hypothetical protein